MQWGTGGHLSSDLQVRKHDSMCLESVTMQCLQSRLRFPPWTVSLDDPSGPPSVCGPLSQCATLGAPWQWIEQGNISLPGALHFLIAENYVYVVNWYAISVPGLLISRDARQRPHRIRSWSTCHAPRLPRTVQAAQQTRALMEHLNLGSSISMPIP